MPRRLRVLARKKPVEWMSCSTSSDEAEARASGVGKAAKRAGVTRFTR
jgi:hypothetical protein